METMSKVQMTCMTTKQKFEVENQELIVLKNGRYAYKVLCPWEGKNGKALYAFKFCSASNNEAYQAQKHEHPTGENFQETTRNDAE